MKCKICQCNLDEEQKSGYVGIAGKIQPVETIKIIIGSGLMIYYPIVYKITPKELQGKKDEYVIVDVRETDELEEGKVDGAVNIPLGQLIRKARHGDLNDLKRKKIFPGVNFMLVHSRYRFKDLIIHLWSGCPSNQP
jgi:rhodanese-related sulfurtransferase